jgi:hypothetical protein
MNHQRIIISSYVEHHWSKEKTRKFIIFLDSFTQIMCGICFCLHTQVKTESKFQARQNAFLSESPDWDTYDPKSNKFLVVNENIHPLSLNIRILAKLPRLTEQVRRIGTRHERDQLFLVPVSLTSFSVVLVIVLVNMVWPRPRSRSDKTFGLRPISRWHS